MTQFLTATAFCFLLSLTGATAQSKRIFAGIYLGNSAIENPVGDRIYYGPIRFKIDNKGIITGTAFNDRTDKLLTISGKIDQVKVQSGIYFTGKSAGRFSDGTKWKVEVTALKGAASNALSGSCSKGTYRGSIQATKN